MGFFKDLINGHEAFLKSLESKKKENRNLQENKFVLLDNPIDEEIKAA